MLHPAMLDTTSKFSVTSVASLQRLPAELIVLIYEYLEPNAEDVTRFRLTCRHIGLCETSYTTEEYLVHDFCFIPHEHSTYRLARLAYKDVVGHDGGRKALSNAVRKLVFQDLHPLPNWSPFFCPYIGFRSLYYRWYKQAMRRFFKYAGADMEAAMIRFDNIKVVEYHSSLVSELSHPDQQLRDIFPDLAPLPDKIARLVLWYTKDIFQPREDRKVQEHSLSLFHGLLIGVLSNTSRRGPLVVRIHTKHHTALETPSTLEPSPRSSPVRLLPSNNTLETLEMTFTGTNKTGHANFSIELRIFCNPYSAGQFSNLRRLQVSGTGIHGFSYVCIKDWGRPGFSPHWPHLRELELAYVRIHNDFVSWVKPLHIRLSIHDVFWDSDSIQDFCTGSNLESVDISGVQVIGFQFEAGTVPLGAARSEEIEETLEKSSEADDEEILYDTDEDISYDTDEETLNDAYEEIPYTNLCYLIAKDEEEARELMAQYSEYCINVWTNRPIELTFVTPDVVNKFCLIGGECPLDFRCVWGDSWYI